MFNIIDPAYAQSAGAAGGFDFMGLLPLVAIFVAFYFFLIRPQQKKAQEQKDMINAIQRGDQVLTAGGIVGLVESVEDNQVVIKVEDGVKLRFVKSAIVEKLSKDTTRQSSREATDNVRSLHDNAKSKSTTARRKPTTRKTTTKK